MGLRDSLRALGLTAVGAAAELARDWASQSLGDDPFAKADPPPKGEGEGDKSKAPQKEGGGAVPTDDDLALADPKSMFWDPFSIIEQLGYKERPTQITYGTLRAILFRMPIIYDIIQTRIDQMASFARPQHDRYQMGFRIKLRDYESEPTAKDKKWIRGMEDLIIHTGVHEDPRHRDNFEKFIRKMMWDSLVYDQMCFEVVPNRAGQPAQWYPIDSTTVRLADTASAYLKKKLRDDTRYVQIYDGMIITEYSEEELCFGVRNPRTDLRLYGYGTAELEMIMTTITSLLWAWQYNQRFFSQGSATKGILNFKGAIPEHQLKGFRRHWYTMLCVGGDTVIRTREKGEIPIGEYVVEGFIRPVTIWNGERYVAARAFKGEQTKQVCVTELANGVRLRTSPDHQFLVHSETLADVLYPDRTCPPGEVWRKQSELVPGDQVFWSDGVNLQCIEVAKAYPTDHYEQMFDVTVENDEHRFAANGIIVHNSGVENAWRTPITNADELQWISVMETNKDMEFNSWMDFQIKCAAAAFRMNPVEINFQYGNVGQRGALNESSNKEKITESKQRGLYPLLRFLAECINTHVVWPTNPNYEFEFVGLDAGTREETAKLNQMRVKTTRTVDELRAEDDLEPMPDGLGEVILDNVWMQWAQQKQAQAEGMAAPGAPGAPGGPEMPGGEEEEPGFDFDQLFPEEEEEEEGGGEEMTARAKERASNKAKEKAGRMGKSLVEIEL